MSNINTERSKSIISPFITGYHFLYYMFDKLLYLMLFCTFGASTITRKAVIYIYKTISETINSTPNAIHSLCLLQDWWVNFGYDQYRVCAS